MSIRNQSVPTPQPPAWQRPVPASDIDETQNRTRQFTPEDGQDAERTKRRMEGIWLKALGRIDVLVSREHSLTLQVAELEAEADRRERNAGERETLAQARKRAWLPASRSLTRETRRMAPAALLGCFLVEFVLKPGPLISAAGLALVSAITVHFAGTGLAEYLERTRLAAQTARSPVAAERDGA
jgi:hypothetical protein